MALAVCTREQAAYPVTSSISPSPTDRVDNCNTDLAPNCETPNPEALITTNPVDLLTVTNEGDTPTNQMTRFVDDQVIIRFTESTQYYGKPSEGPDGITDANSASHPRVVFGNNVESRVGSGVFASYSVSAPSAGAGQICQWTHEYIMNWGAFLNTYGGSINSQTAGANEFYWSQDGSIIRYDVNFNIVNYEWVHQVRPGTVTDISVERVIRHALPFSLKFQTQATISSSVQVYSNIVALAAIVSQSVTLIDFNGNANANIMLYTSVQWPFVIDELRVHRSSELANYLGDEPSDVGGSVGTQPLNAYAAAANEKYNLVTGMTQSVATGPGGVNAGVANVDAAAGSSCLANSVCSQVWPIGLSTQTGSSTPACDFTADYYVYFTLRCHDAFLAANGKCPINIDNAHGGQRIIVGSENTAVTGTNQNFFKLEVTSSYHCTTVVDNIGLSAKLYTHGQPIGTTPATAVQSSTGPTSFVVTGANLPSIPYNYAPVPQSSDPDSVAWGPSGDAAEAIYDLDAKPNGKTAFLNGQWVFGVALVKVQQATVVRASFDSLTLAGFATGAPSRDIIVDGAVVSTWTSDSASSLLKFFFVDDTSTVNVNSAGHRIAYPYFFFQVSQTALGIPADGNQQITFTGTIKVTYQNAASFSNEETEKLIPFSYTVMTSSKTKAQAVSTSVGIGNGATASGSTANSTFLGVSSSTAAGVALAVGVVVGLLVGLLVSATRRRPAPTKTESQVQLTNSAATSAV